MKQNFKPSIQGLAELQAIVDGKRIQKELAKNLSSYVWSLHKALDFELVKRYNTPSRTGLTSMLLRKSASSEILGKNVIKSSIEYRYKPVDLSKFRPVEWEWGNINPATRKGQVHSVMVKRANGMKIVYGLNHLGGFIPKRKTGKDSYANVVFPKYGTQMFERDGPDQYPIHLLFGPSLTDMAEYLFDNRIGSVADAIDNIETFISDTLFGM